jgi:hypothetical protein
MHIPEDPRYGKTIEVPLRLGKRAGVRIVVALLVPLFFIVVPSFAHAADARLTVVRVSGFVLLPICAYIAYSVYRAASWKDCRFRLTRQDVTIPLYPVHRRQSATLALEDLVTVRTGSIGGHLALELVDRERTYNVPWDWFPKEWDPRYVGMRLQARVRLRHEGRSMTAKEVAVAEAALDQAASGGEGMVIVHGTDDDPKLLVEPR